MAERRNVLRRHLHGHNLPLRAIRIPQMNLSALRVKAHCNGLNRHIAAPRHSDIAGCHFQFEGVHVRRFKGQKFYGADREEQRRYIETDDQRDG